MNIENNYNDNASYILSLDVSTSCIGIALFQDMGDHGELKLLHHVSPKVKPQPQSKMEELFRKVEIFEQEFLANYSDFGITKVVIEEPLLQSNNVYTIATLLRFNGMISKSVYDTVGIVPDFISSYDARKYFCSDLMAVRHFKKDGTPLTDKAIAKNTPVLFGAHPFDIDKKMVLWDLISNIYPQIIWFYDKNNKLKKENFDMSDAAVAGLGYMHKLGFWDENKIKN
jgi:hypothetical protein